MAYPIFSLSEFFLPQCQTLLGSFTILFLTWFFSLLSHTPFYFSLPPVFSFKSPVSFPLHWRVHTGLGKKDRPLSIPRKGTLSWSLNRERAKFLFKCFSPSTSLLIQVCSHCSIPLWYYFQREFCDPNSTLTLALHFLSESSTEIFSNCKQDMLNTLLRGVLGMSHQQFKVWVPFWKRMVEGHYSRN